MGEAPEEMLVKDQIQVDLCNSLLKRVDYRREFNLSTIVNVIRTTGLYDRVKTYTQGLQILKGLEASNLVRVVNDFLLNYDYIRWINPDEYKLTEKGIKAKELGGHLQYQNYIADLEATELKLKKTTIKVNKSLNDTNDSIRKTNRISIWIAALTGVFIALQALHDLGIINSPKDKALEQNNQLLNRLLQDQRNQDSINMIQKKPSKIK